MVTKRIELYGLEEALSLFGEYDRNLRYLENKYGVQIFARSNIVSIRGRSIKVENAYQAITEMREMLRANKNMAGFKLDPGIENKSIIPSNSTAQNQYLKNGNGTSQLSSIYVTYRGKPVIPQTLTQQSYTDKIAENDIVIAIGPAGTGKTFLAAAMALAAWEKGKVARIILTRPVVEAGEKLGFLPGDFSDKVDPYLRPLYDALYAMIGPDRFQQLREENIIEIVPLAYMRGRTLDDAFIVLDEAQNTTIGQMKMFLTRTGFNSQVVVTGDITQIDLPNKSASGLVVVQKVLSKIPGIVFVEFKDTDIVRHKLVKDIIRAFAKYENAGNSDGENG